VLGHGGTGRDGAPAEEYFIAKRAQTEWYVSAPPVRISDWVHLRVPVAIPRVVELRVDLQVRPRESVVDPIPVVAQPRPPDDVHTPVPFDMWREHLVDAPWAIPEAYFIAVVGGEYAGVSSLFRPQIGDWLNQGLTGVRRTHRGRGIATALKVRTVQYGRDHDVREIRTWNEINNQRMLAINGKFGFVRQPAWLTFQKEFGE